MNSTNNKRRILGAVLLTIVCFMASAAPAAAFDRDAYMNEDHGGLFARVALQIQSGVSTVFAKLGIFWNATGAIIED